MKELRKECLEIIKEVGGIDNILNSHKNELCKRYNLTDVDNCIDYFRYSNQGIKKVRKVLGK